MEHYHYETVIAWSNNVSSTSGLIAAFIGLGEVWEEWGGGALRGHGHYRCKGCLVGWLVVLV